MKIRNGFVSNSSSSSFIVGIGRIPEGMPINEIANTPSAAIISGTGLIEKSKQEWSRISIRNGKITVSGGGNEGWAVFIPFDPEKDLGAWFYVINLNNNEGDDAFYVDSGGKNYGLDYDIDLSWFSQHQQEAYEQIKKFEGSQVFYGAERNG